MSQPVIDRPIRDIARALRQGKATSTSLVAEAQARFDSLGTTLFAYKHWDGERAQAVAGAIDAHRKSGYDAGPLMGLPASIKDIYGVAGMPICGGTPQELPETWQREGPVVAALGRAQCVFMGKTHTVEFAFGGVGTNAHWDSPRNPWDPSAHRACGGSSSGAGVSLAMGTAVVAMGTDTGGSVRIPASVTGNVGLKTSAGRWSTDGILPLSTTFDTPGPLTRTVEDAALAFAAIDPDHDDGEALLASMDGLEPGDLRLGICDEHFWDDCAPGIAEGVKSAVDELTKLGAHVTRISLPEAGQARALIFDRHLFGVEGLSHMEEDYPDRFASLDPNVAYRFGVARQVTAIDYYTTLRQVHALAVAAADRLRHVDVLVTPTVPVPPPVLADVAEAKSYNAVNAMMTRNTMPGNLLELCALTMPVALCAESMPVGLQLLARHGQEERLLAVALACEKALGTAAERIGVAPMSAA